MEKIERTTLKTTIKIIAAVALCLAVLMLYGCPPSIPINVGSPNGDVTDGARIRTPDNYYQAQKQQSDVVILTDGEEVFRYAGFGSLLKGMAFSPDSQRIAFMYHYSGPISVVTEYQIGSNELYARGEHPDYYHDMRYSQDGQSIILSEGFLGSVTVPLERVSGEGEGEGEGEDRTPNIQMGNGNPVTVEVGSVYVDAGATAIDNHDGALTVTVQSNVNTSVVGTYYVVYTVTDSSGNTATATRTVYVVDRVKPVITIISDNPVTTPLGVEYVDAGATANDNYDGDLTADIIVTSTVDTATAGTYTVTYNVSDSSGNAATPAIRTVIVRLGDFGSPVKIGGTNSPQVSLALDPYLPKLAVAYIDRISETEFKLMYAELAGAGWEVQEIDTGFNIYTNRQCSLTFDDRGQPIIAYWDGGEITTNLYCARLTDSGWQKEFVYSNEFNCSVVFNPNYTDTIPKISIFFNTVGVDWNLYRADYTDASGWIGGVVSWADASLESAKFDPITGTVGCSYQTFGWTGNPSGLGFYGSVGGGIVEEDGDSVGVGQSLAYSTITGYPRISHGGQSSASGYSLRYSHWDGQSWQNEIATLSGQSILDTSIAIHSGTDLPRVAYVDIEHSELIEGGRVYFCNLYLAEYDGQGWNTKMLVGSGQAYNSVSMALAPNGKAIVAYGSPNGAYVVMESGAWPLEPTIPPAPAGFMKGMNYSSWWRGEYQTPESDAALGQLAALGANWVSVVVTAYQETISSTAIDIASEKTVSDDDIRQAVNTAHQLGQKVMLKPHLDLSNDPGHWRGQINFTTETDWQAWFSAYQAMILHYADLAEQLNVEMLCVGTELGGTVSRYNDWLNTFWYVSQHFSGLTTYAANWDGEVAAIDWWVELDYVGVDAYYPLTNISNPTLEELKTAWLSRADELRPLRYIYGRPIIFTEIGYRSSDGTNQHPWYKVLDLEEQADCYRAALETLWGQNWLGGIFWWYWQPTLDQGGTSDEDYTPVGKPAEEVIREYYAH
ncbi:MAG: immunoglobulin-like domain-containing protein [Patescibacteria group bacterium]